MSDKVKHIALRMYQTTAVIIISIRYVIIKFWKQYPNNKIQVTSVESIVAVY